MTAAKALKNHKVLNNHFIKSEAVLAAALSKKVDARKEISATKKNIARVEPAVEKRYRNHVL